LNQAFGDDAESFSRSLSDWPCAALAAFARRCPPPGNRSTGKWLTLYEGFSRALEEAGVTGALLEAAGPEIILEAASSATVSRKHQASTLKIHAAHLHKCAVAEGAHTCEESEALAVSPADYYWRASLEITQEFEGSSFEHMLKEALTPQPRQAVLYTSVRVHSKDGLDVTAVAEEVSQFCDAESLYQFKIVTALIPSSSAAVKEEPMKKKKATKKRAYGGRGAAQPTMIAKNNLIFVRTENDEWWLLASVDFDQHGSSPAGHWHVNRAPLGELVPHWGSRGEVLHGGPSGCPLFWLLIPKEATYSSTPRRSKIIALLDEKSQKK
jgi:hypothetical protein